MIKDEELMRMLCRAAAMTKRNPATDGGTPPGEPARPHIRGYGHILSTLVAETSGGQGISQQELADSVGIRPQSLSEALLSLEERGFVERQTSEVDKRKTLVCITEAGAEHSRLLTAERIARAQKVFGILSDGEKENLFYLLGKLTKPHNQP